MLLLLPSPLPVLLLMLLLLPSSLHPCLCCCCCRWPSVQLSRHTCAAAAQAECDSQGTRVLRRYLEARKLERLVKEVTGKRRGGGAGAGGGGGVREGEGGERGRGR